MTIFYIIILIIIILFILDILDTKFSLFKTADKYLNIAENYLDNLDKKSENSPYSQINAYHICSASDIIKLVLSEYPCYIGYSQNSTHIIVTIPGKIMYFEPDEFKNIENLVKTIKEYEYFYSGKLVWG